MQLVQTHREWLLKWLSAIESEIENGDVSASLCLQGILKRISGLWCSQNRLAWCDLQEYLIDQEWHTNRLFRAVREAAVSFQLLASKSGSCYTLHDGLLNEVCLSTSQQRMKKYTELITKNDST